MTVRKNKIHLKEFQSSCFVPLIQKRSGVKKKMFNLNLFPHCEKIDFIQ